MKKLSIKKNLPKIIIVSLIIAIVGFVFYAMTRPDTPGGNNSSKPKVSADTSKLSKGNSQGPEGAKVVVTEFGDYQCPACKRDFPIVKNSILPKYDGQIRFVFLNYPLPIHNNAVPGAKAAEAAALQGKFWEMHDLLYEKQDDWVKQKDPQSKFEEFAKELGLNVDQFKQDYKSQKVADLISENEALAEAFNVPGTPTYFVNGTQVQGGTEDLQKAIDKALAQ